MYNPQIPSSDDFALTPNQEVLERDDKVFLHEHFDISFNNLLAITNLPLGKTKFHLERKALKLTIVNS